MDLVKILGTKKTKQRKPELICQYDLWCPKCGYKSASWSINGPNAKFYVGKSFEDNIKWTALPTHAEHGTFIIIDKKVSPWHG